MLPDPDWIAPREGQDWRDENVLRAVEWLKSFVPKLEMDRRLDAARATLQTAWAQARDGQVAPQFDPADLAAWYVLQGETFATDREFISPDGLLRVVPYLTRLGIELERLKGIRDVELRAERLMTAERRQPDAGIYELLVALAYRRHDWRVEFVPEVRGGGRTPDLHVFRNTSRWAVECKRLAPSTYAERERGLGKALAQPVHTLALQAGQSIVVELAYKVELEDVPAAYLADRVGDAIARRSARPWEDEVTSGRVRPVRWGLAHKVMRHDDVYFGSSRMIELIAGQYLHEADYSFSAKWRPAGSRPAYAAAVYQASIVTWVSRSRAALEQKSRHFRRTLAKAEGQLPADRPGVIHIGIETTGGAQVDSRRHLYNLVEAKFFHPGRSRLRWVYANYFVPEATTDENETWAITETMAPYRVGQHSTRWPLPGHMVISDEAQSLANEVHWDPRPRR